MLFCCVCIINKILLDFTQLIIKVPQIPAISHFVRHNEFIKDFFSRWFMKTIKMSFYQLGFKYTNL